MAQWYRARVTIPHDSGLPKDAIVNTWHYMVGGSGDRDLIATDFGLQLEGFYSAWVVGFGHTDYNWPAAEIEHFDFLEDQPRVPFLTQSKDFGVAPAANNNLPAEVSLCLSFQGPVASGVNMRRRRGRVYLGPLSTGSADLPTAGGIIASIAGYANTAFFDTLNVAQLAVYSFYTHHGVPVGTTYTNDDDFPELPESLPSSFTSVTRLWIDDAWDIQRRRGLSPSTRTTHNKP